MDSVPPSFHQIATQRHHHNLGPVLAAEFLQYPVNMGFNRPLSDEQFFGDLIIAEPIGHLLQDFLLPLG